MDETTTETDGTARRHLIVTLQLPDRPGALGSVASRIGALGAAPGEIRHVDGVVAPSVSHPPPGCCG